MQLEVHIKVKKWWSPQAWRMARAMEKVANWYLKDNEKLFDKLVLEKMMDEMLYGRN